MRTTKWFAHTNDVKKNQQSGVATEVGGGGGGGTLPPSHPTSLLSKVPELHNSTVHPQLSKPQLYELFHKIIIFNDIRVSLELHVNISMYTGPNFSLIRTIFFFLPKGDRMHCTLKTTLAQADTHANILPSLLPKKNDPTHSESSPLLFVQASDC